MRRIFYAAAIGTEEFAINKRNELIKLRELEKEVMLAKNIMTSVEQRRDSDPATLIRLEGKLNKIERQIREKRRVNYN
jgi:hypothetical protein